MSTEPEFVRRARERVRLRGLMGVATEQSAYDEQWLATYDGLKFTHRKEGEPLQNFALAVLRQWHNDGERGDLDGWWLQEAATTAGVCTVEKRKTPCEEGCVCEEIVGTGEEVECYPIRDDLSERMDEPTEEHETGTTAELWMPGWQPITDAQKNDTDHLVGGWIGQPEKRAWIFDTLRWDTVRECWRDENLDCFWPTHYLPLPLPP